MNVHYAEPQKIGGMNDLEGVGKNNQKVDADLRRRLRQPPACPTPSTISEGIEKWQRLLASSQQIGT